MSIRVDYDALAPVYDAGPHRGKSFDAVLEAFLSERDFERQVHVLDVACGTGAQLAANRHEWPDLRCVGLDASMEMLRIAQARDLNIVWLRGDAAALPFIDKSFDFVSNQYALHHIDRKYNFLAEVARVLRSGGRLSIRNLDPWSMQNWVLYRYFPTALERDCRDFIPIHEVTEALEVVGLVNVRTIRRLQTESVTLGELVGDVRNRHGRSQLIAISDPDYASGLARVEADMARLGSSTQVASEKCNVTITGDKP